MTVGETSSDLELSSRQRGLAAQPPSDHVDEIRRQVGEVAERLVLDLAVFAVGTAEQVGGVDLALVVL